MQARSRSLVLLGIPVIAAGVVSLTGSAALADPVTDWTNSQSPGNEGLNGATGAGVKLDSNLSTRIEARAVFDAVNSIDHFSPRGYSEIARHDGYAAAAAAQAAHDVLLAQLPDPASDSTADVRWSQTRSWLDTQLASDLASLGVSSTDGGIAAGNEAAAGHIASTLASRAEL